MGLTQWICAIRGHRWEAEPDGKGGLHLSCPRCGTEDDRPPGTIAADPMTVRDRALFGQLRERTQWFPDRTDKS